MLASPRAESAGPLQSAALRFAGRDVRRKRVWFGDGFADQILAVPLKGGGERMGCGPWGPVTQQKRPEIERGGRGRKKDVKYEGISQDVDENKR